LRCGWLDLPLLRYAAAVAGPLDGIVVNHLDQVHDTEWQLCEAYGNAALTLSATPQLSRQTRMTQELRRAEPRLSPATPDRIVRSLSELAPVVLTSTGPTCEHRACTELPFRKRRTSR
jgi:adenylosuccinate synthase